MHGEWYWLLPSSNDLMFCLIRSLLNGKLRWNFMLTWKHAIPFSSWSKFVTICPAGHTKISSEASVWIPAVATRNNSILSQAFHSVVWWVGGINNAWIEIHRVQAEYNENLERITHCKNSLSNLPRSPSLEISEPQLDAALSNLLWSHSWPCLEQKVGLETSRGPFHSEISCDLINTCSYPDLVLLSKAAINLPALCCKLQPATAFLLTWKLTWHKTFWMSPSYLLSFTVWLPKSMC